MTIINRSIGSGYATASQVRAYSGVPSTTDTSDADLATLIAYASAELHRDIAIREMAVRLSGDIDGSNTTYLLPYPYVADRNLDGSVTTADVEVRTATRDADTGAITRSTATVSSIDARQGRVVLSSAPASTVTFIEADFERYLCPVYSDDLTRACVALTAHYLYVRNRDPSRVTLSQLKGSGDGVRWNSSGASSFNSKFLDEYRRIVRTIRNGDLAREREDINRSGESESIERG